MEIILSTPQDLKEIVKIAFLELGLESNTSKSDSQKQTDNLYTLPEAAAYCRMPVPTFRAHLSKRNVSGSKPGKSWVFTQKDLEKFLQKFYCKTSDELRDEVYNGQHTSSRRK